MNYEILSIIKFDLLSEINIKCSSYEIDKYKENLCERIFPSIPQKDFPFIASPSTWIQRVMGWNNFVDGWAKMLGLSCDSIKPPIRYPDISDKLRVELDTIDKIEKIVLIAPEAQTFGSFDPCMWNEIVKNLKSQGFSVVINIMNKDYYIRGTYCINMSISDLIGLGYKCHAVYSLRSGLCDCLVNKGTDLHVFYSPQISIDYFSLNRCFDIKNKINEYDTNVIVPKFNGFSKGRRAIKKIFVCVCEKLPHLVKGKKKLNVAFRMKIFERVNIHSADNSKKITWFYIFGKRVWTNENT